MKKMSMTIVFLVILVGCASQQVDTEPQMDPYTESALSTLAAKWRRDNLIDKVTLQTREQLSDLAKKMSKVRKTVPIFTTRKIGKKQTLETYRWYADHTLCELCRHYLDDGDYITYLAWYRR